MQKWEHQIITLIRYDQCKSVHEWAIRNEEHMNAQGELGWELVETYADTPPDDLLDNINVPRGEYRVALFKKPIEE